MSLSKCGRELCKHWSPNRPNWCASLDMDLIPVTQDGRMLTDEVAEELRNVQDTNSSNSQEG